MKGQLKHARRPSTKTVQQSKWKKHGVETTNQIKYRYLYHQPK